MSRKILTTAYRTRLDRINSSDTGSIECLPGTLIYMPDEQKVAVSTQGTCEWDLIGSGGGAGRVGWQDFADGTTATTPLEITGLTGGSVILTNDTSGSFTDGNVHDNSTTTPEGITDIWSADHLR